MNTDLIALLEEARHTPLGQLPETAVEQIVDRITPDPDAIDVAAFSSSI
jgi:FXSXX-COOH protein